MDYEVIVFMSDLPVVSVIVPVFNAAKSLRASVDSLLKQSLTGLEIILVNDASTDQSGLIIDNLAADYPHILAVHLKQNLGAHEARLEGLRRSSAPWIGFLDADDYARTDMYARLYGTATAQDVDIVLCGSNLVSADRKVLATKVSFSSPKRVEERLFERFCTFDLGTGALWNKLFRRELIEPFFFLNLPWRQRLNEDFILNLACFSRARSIFLLPDSLHEYASYGQGVTARLPPALAYVETYRACAAALNALKGLTEEQRGWVIQAYRIQFSWPECVISNHRELKSYGPELAEAANLLAAVDPASLAGLSARLSPPRGRVRAALEAILRFIGVRPSLL